MEDIDVGMVTATNTSTGSTVTIETRPRELSLADAWYENPTFGLKVGVFVMQVVDQIERDPSTSYPRWPRHAVGLVVDGGLRRRISDGLGEKSNDDLTSMLVIDCYRLLRALYAHHYFRPGSDSEFQLYEPDPRYLAPFREQIEADRVYPPAFKPVVI